MCLSNVYNAETNVKKSKFENIFFANEPKLLKNNVILFRI